MERSSSQLSPLTEDVWNIEDCNSPGWEGLCSVVSPLAALCPCHSLSGRAECWCVTLWQLLLTVGPWTLPPQHSTQRYQPHSVFALCPLTQGLAGPFLDVCTSLVTSLHLSVDVSPVVTGNSRLVFTVFTVISGAHCPSSLCTHCCTHCCTLYTEHWTHSVHNTSLSSTLQLSLTLRIPHRTSLSLSVRPTQPMQYLSL